MLCVQPIQYITHCVILELCSIIVKMNLDGPICGRIVSTETCITSSADFDFMGTANKNDECRSMQVNIHLKPHLDLSNGPM